MGKPKITRTLLDDYRKNKELIPILEYELEEMKRGENGIGSSTIMDYRTGFPRPQAITGFDWKLYERRKKALERTKSKVSAVEEWVKSIEDGQTRNVFKMYYIDGMTWIRIAAKIGRRGEEYPRKMIRDKYLDEKNIK